MHGLAIVSLAAFWLASVAVGLRLARLWTRTRELPEILIASAFLAGGVVATGCNLLLRADAVSGAAVPVLVFGARLAGSWSASAMIAFAWRVFRPDRAWARRLAYVGLAVVALRLAGELATLRPLDEVRHPLFWLWTALTLFAYGWTGFEALAYHARLRRRLRVGLADPVVANRILLWGVAALCIAIQGPILAASAWLGAETASAPPLRLGLSGLSLACAAAIWLAFFPPRAYVARLERRGALGA
jgi:hypothetical protein